MGKIYLDYAAATPMDQRVIDAMSPFLKDQFYNPSALYAGAREAKAELEEARSRVGRVIGARPSEIIFTAGGTESANLALYGVMARYPDATCLISGVEHDAVRMPAQKWNHGVIDVDDKGRLKLDDLKKKMNDEVVLVSVMYANNEVGTVEPIAEVVALVAEIRKDRRRRGVTTPIYVHTDACQAPLYLDINVARLGVDLMTLNGGKLYGPKQSGILYHRIGTDLQPQILGGGQEQGYRSGTENVAACVGFATALEIASQGRQERVKTLHIKSSIFIKGLESLGAVLNGHSRHRLPNNIHVSFPGADNERMLFSLDDQGIFAAAGSACSASSEEASHVLMAMGFSEEQARSSIRFSISHLTTEDELRQALDAVRIAFSA